MRDGEAATLLAALPEEERYSTWHLAERDGRLLDRGPAGTRLLLHLGWKRLAGVTARLEGPVTSVYELTASQRSRLGYLVPDGPAPRRFP